jgi:alpha-mannosidase
VTLSRLERRLREVEGHLGRLGAWRDERAVTLPDWTFQAPGRAGVRLQEGQPWPEGPITLDDQPVRLRCEWTVTPDWEGLPLELLLDVGGEALLTASLDGEVVYRGGLNPYHRRAPLTWSARAGQRLSAEVVAVPRGLFGSPVPRPHLERARVCAPQPQITALLDDLTVTAAAIRTLGRGALEGGGDLAGQGYGAEIAARLLNLTDEVVGALAWPSAAAGHLARLHELGGGESFTQGIWSLPRELPPTTPLSPEVTTRVAHACMQLRVGLAHLRAEYPPRGRLALTGHAHLDLGWLWPVPETRRKGVRTLNTVMELMDRYPDFTFNQSSAQLYAWIEQDDPELFAKITRRVAEGRFEPVGGMWVEPDCQMSGGEALARHLLYGQGYFREKFGRTCEVAWLPDTFGFTPALPQLLVQGGVTGFFTTKLNWNEETRFPHDLFMWEGLDGTRIPAHSLNNPGGSRPGLGGYNGDVQPSDLLGTWENFGGKAAPGWGEEAPVSLFTFGYGDGGGGPSAPMLEAYDLLRDFPGLPALHMTRVDDLFRRLPQEGLPVWVGELYLQLHRGTLTSQARVKHLNRQAEHRLLEAEALCALAGADPEEGAAAGAGAQSELGELWKTTLLNQFHDILPGSSIREVYGDTVPELEGVAARAAELARACWTPETDTWTVANPLPWPRPLSVLLPADAGPLTADGAALPTQAVEGGLLVHAPDQLVPAMGTLTLRRSAGPAATSSLPVSVTVRQDNFGTVLDNGALRAEIGEDGVLRRLTDLRTGREVLGPQGHVLRAYPDLPYAWDAWDVARDLGAAHTEVLDGPCTVRVVEDGPLRGAVQVTRPWRASQVTQTFRLCAGSARLEITLDLDWQERHTLLRAESDLNVRAHEAWAETALGAQPRPTHRNTPDDAAHFEVSAHRWMDLSEPGYGVSLLNDGRYGHSVRGSLLALSVVRGPMWPDPQADLGPHTLTYALYPHAGDWRGAHTPREALDLNSPLLAQAGRLELRAAPHLGGLPLMLSALKRSEDGQSLILRVYEPAGQRGEATVTLGRYSAERVNLLEDPLPGEAGDRLEHGVLHLQVRPFETVSLRLSPAGTP